MTAAPPLIAFAHVGKSFDGGRGAKPVLAVNDVSLDVTEGELLAIVGGSGSGKTTLLRLANRLIEADVGTITIEGADVRSVDPVQLQTARTFGVAGWKLLWQIVLPASSPYIFTGMRVSLAVALIVMVISEMVAASSGIGYFILSAQRGFKIREMFAGVLTLAALGYVLNRLFLAIENRVLAWHYGYTQQQRN